MQQSKKRKKILVKKKRSLDPNIIIDYKRPDILRKFITDRGKIIPRRISGATALQQRRITREIKRARYLALLPFCASHIKEKKPYVEALMQVIASGVRPVTSSISETNTSAANSSTQLSE